MLGKVLEVAFYTIAIIADSAIHRAGGLNVIKFNWCQVLTIMKCQLLQVYKYKVFVATM